MSSCCYEAVNKIQNPVCSSCGQKGKTIELITLKSLLKPQAMRLLNPAESFAFCRSADCPVVYFNGQQRKKMCL
jgi:hypothetical protein